MTPERWNSPLLNNGWVSMFPWQQIDAVTDGTVRDGGLYSVRFEVTEKVEFSRKCLHSSSVLGDS
jgi:hypothetical protein